MDKHLRSSIVIRGSWARAQLLVLLCVLPGIAVAQTPAVTPLSLEIFLANGAKLSGDARRDTIKLDELVSLLHQQPKPFLIDVRSPAEFNAAHLKGAVNLPESELTEAKLVELGVAKDRRIILYCQNSFFPTRMVALTHPAYSALRQMEYSSVSVLAPVWLEKGGKEKLRGMIEGPEADRLFGLP